MSTRDISLGVGVGGCKGGQCIGLTTLPPSCAYCLEIWEHETPGTLRACPGLYLDCFTVQFIVFSDNVKYLMEQCDIDASKFQ